MGRALWLLVLGLGSADAATLSARFGPLLAVVGEDVEIAVEVTDDTQVVSKVVVELRRGRDPWRALDAVPQGVGATRWWRARFAGADLWPAPSVEVRARLFGSRGGILMELGEPEPLDVEVLTRPEAQLRERVFARYSPATEDEAAFSLTGYLGADTRFGTRSRARLFLGAGGQVTEQVEILFVLSAGPSFAVPDTLQGGPLTLGFELGPRIFSGGAELWDFFLAPYGSLDLRLPGVDAGLGLKAGIRWRATAIVAFEAALGGAAMAFDVTDPRLGGTGGLTLAARFGAPPPEER